MPSSKIIKLLGCRAQNKAFSYLPQVIFIADDPTSHNKVIPHLPPKQSLVILRMYHNLERNLLAEKIAKLCKKYQIKLLIAGDPYLALKVRADGLHISDSSCFYLKKWRTKMPQWIITASAHNLQRLIAIKKYGLTAAIYSPIFPTITHPERKHIGVLRFMKHTNNLNFPVYALGGINAHNVQQLYHARIAGIAGINIFTEE